MMKTVRGFSLVEMMTVIAVMGILMGIALPSFQTYLVNNRIRNAAELFMASVMLAKAESSSRNVNVELLLTTAGPADVATTEPVASAPGWMIRPFDRSEYIEGKLLSEDGQSTVSITGATPAVVFTSLGATTLATLPTPVAAATFSFSSPAGGTCQHETPPGTLRCLNIRITATGRAKMCDPFITVTSPTDPRACT